MLVTLIFGGNQGDRKALIGEAITEMSSIGKIELCSSLYETAPWGFKSSDSFYNQIVTYETNLLPEEVLDWMWILNFKLSDYEKNIEYKVDALFAVKCPFDGI